MDAEHRFAKRLSLAHCHAPGNPIGWLQLPVGQTTVSAVEEHRLFLLESGDLQCARTPWPAISSRIVRAGESLACDVSTTATLRQARFSVRLPGAIDALTPLQGHLLAPHPQPQAILLAWDALMEAATEARSGDVWARPRLRGAFTIVLSRTVADGFQYGQWAVADEERPPWLVLVLKAMDQRLAEADLKIETLADLAALSPSHFAHRFRDLLGIAPKSYLLKSRLTRATQLLRDGDEAIKRISSLCGFRDADHFTESFRRSTGLTPTAYRAQHSGEP